MLEFETWKNTYAWDDEVGLFVPFSKTMRAVMNRISSPEHSSRDSLIDNLKEDFKEEDIAFCYDWIKKWNRILPQNHHIQIPQDLSEPIVREFVLRYCLIQLTLNVTEDCNFRCRYCIYSDQYKNTRCHSKSYMSSDIAMKAIDRYFSLLEDGRWYNPSRKPSIGFYGGEPLLNFDLIKNAVEHIERTYNDFSVNYNMTTNGSLMNKEKAEWLMQHGFKLSISLDGPKEEHNRNRIYSSGKGTFDDVMKNVTLIMDSGYKKVDSIAVLDWKSNLFKLEEFFDREDVPPLSRASLVSDIGGCRYYEQFSKEEKLSFQRQFDDAKKRYLEILSDQKERERPSFFDVLFASGARNTIYGPVSICEYPQIKPYTATCIPGRKIFVDVYGNFHICERVPETFPIGNIDEGLSFKKISDTLNKFFQSTDMCPNCKIKRECFKCFALLMTKEGFLTTSKACETVEIPRIKAFAEALAIAEISPKIIEQLSPYYDNTKNYYEE